MSLAIAFSSGEIKQLITGNDGNTVSNMYTKYRKQEKLKLTCTQDKVQEMVETLQLKGTIGKTEGSGKTTLTCHFQSR